MSLEGNLSAFGLSEILQLIAVQQKTGVLSITRQSSSMALFFRNGKIISTRDRRRSAKDPLKDYLARYGIISREELARLSEISTKSKLDITDVILSESVLGEEALEGHCRRHIQEAIHDILTWEQCSYRFISGTHVVEGIKPLGEFGIEGLLMESMRRIDEFPQMLKEFPDGGMTVKRSGVPSEDHEFSRNESLVFRMLSEETQINDLVTRAKLPRYETYEALKHLKEKDLIEVEESRILEPELDIGKKITKKPRRGRRRNPLPVILSVIVFASCAFWGLKSVLPIVEGGTGGGLGITLTASNSLVKRHEIENELRWFLEAYRAKRGVYPGSLSGLEESGLVTHQFLEKIRVYSFRYYLTPEGDRYTLL